MKDIYLLQGFNNYFNRKVKYFADLDSYTSVAEYDSFSNVNFNPNDGVNATHIIGGQTQQLSGIPDYFLVVNEDGETIESRWFVKDAEYTRNGQYKLVLKRDSIADHYNELLNTPVFVEKGMLGINNPLIFNAEGNKFNQIKKSEQLLKDETNTNWIVGYIAQETKEENPISSMTLKTGEYTELSSLALNLIDEAHPEIGANYVEFNGSAIFSGYVGSMRSSGYVGSESQEVQAWFGGDHLLEYRGAVQGKYNPLAYTHFGSINVYYPQEGLAKFATNKWGEVFRKYYKSVMHKPFINYLQSINQAPISLADKAEITALNGKKIYSAKTGKYYILRVGGTTSEDKVLTVNDVQPALLAAFETMKSYFFEGIPEDQRNLTTAGDPYWISYTTNTVNVYLDETTGPGVITTKISTNRQHLTDAPYDMFAIPFTIDNLNLATQINLRLNKNVYDLQILPYCPVRKLVSPTGIDLTQGVEDTDFNYITGDGGHNVSYILWASSSSDSFVINYKIPVASSAIELKVQNECDMYRLTSPNYNGSFEFSVAKNDGVDYFEVNYTYKPYSPYIHVCPNFKGLYGKDFDDARGLICGGDFSIAMTSDAWRTYEINNKNYQNIFNTQIKTMDTLHNLEMGSNALASMLGAATTGAGIGILSGNAKFGVGMGLASAGAGAIDMILNQSSYETSRKAKIQMYNFELGNIKARPDSLTKISAYNINNKYFPFVEHYSCTEQEKEALRNKITYDGMTVMAIGKPIDYIGTGYFKGQLIRCETIKDDSHIVNDIYNELNQGVYLNG